MRIVKAGRSIHVVGGPVPPGADAITLGRVILVRNGREGSRHLMNHERVHVTQWAKYGVLGFASRYLGSYAVSRLQRFDHRSAYLRIPLECEAEWNARRMRRSVAP